MSLKYLKADKLNNLLLSCKSLYNLFSLSDLFEGSIIIWRNAVTLDNISSEHNLTHRQFWIHLRGSLNSAMQILVRNTRNLSVRRWLSTVGCRHIIAYMLWRRLNTMNPGRSPGVQTQTESDSLITSHLPGRTYVLEGTG